MKAEGLRGAYATALKGIILKYAGAQNLARLAFAVQDREPTQGGGGYGQQQQIPDTRWVFGGFEYRSGNLVPLNIASIRDYVGLQTIDSFPRQRGNKEPITISPPIAIPDKILGALNPATGAEAAAAIEKGRAAARKIQNPNNYTASNSDCASCHMAKHALVGQQQQASDLDFKSYTFRLEASIPQLAPFRLFGWEQNRPIVSARVVNETAVVLEYLNTRVLR
jgi:hypothetical protein